MELEIKQIMLGAKENAQKVIDEAKKKGEAHLNEINKETKQKEEEWKLTENRLIKKDEMLDGRQVEIDKEVEKIKAKIEEVKKVKERVDNMEAEKDKELEKITHLSIDDAKGILFKNIEDKYEEDLLIRMQKMESLNAEKLDRRAKDILSTTINRLASSTASEMMTTSVNIPNDDIKGKIIGKEGRNIRAFEKTSGVELIIDETPGAIVISSFDPVRRQVARLALENLILDGRIQPAKIEEVVAKAKKKVTKQSTSAVYLIWTHVSVPLLAVCISELLMGKMFSNTRLKWLTLPECSPKN
jgi:ribonuclease Y